MNAKAPIQAKSLNQSEYGFSNMNSWHDGLQNKHHASPIVKEVVRSPGRPLDKKTRTSMEMKFGHDFSNVRLHDDAKALQSATLLNAKAWTLDSHIALGAKSKGKPSRNLLAHELAHVVQQTQEGPKTSVQRAESEAEVASSRVESGQAFNIQSSVTTGAPLLKAEAEIGNIVSILDKKKGKIRVVRVDSTGKILEGIAEITPPPGTPLTEELVDKGTVGIRLDPSDPSRINVVTPEDYKGSVADKRKVQVKEEATYHKQLFSKYDADVAQRKKEFEIEQYRQEAIRYFQWLDDNKKNVAHPAIEEVKQMSSDELLKQRQNYINQSTFSEYALFVQATLKDRAVIRKLGSLVDEGWTIKNYNEFTDTTPEIPPLKPGILPPGSKYINKTGVSGELAFAFSGQRDEVGLRFNEKIRDNSGVTIGYHQRWHVYIKGKGLHEREVILDLDGNLIDKPVDRKVSAAHEQAIDNVIGIIPVLGDAVEIIELNLIAATGEDKWGNPVSDTEFFLRIGAVAIPGALAGAFAKRSAGKAAARRVAADAQIDALNKSIKASRKAAVSPELKIEPPPNLELPTISGSRKARPTTTSKSTSSLPRPMHATDAVAPATMANRQTPKINKKGRPKSAGAAKRGFTYSPFDKYRKKRKLKLEKKRRIKTKQSFGHKSRTRQPISSKTLGADRRELGRQIIADKKVLPINESETVIGRNIKRSWKRSKATSRHRDKVAAYINARVKQDGHPLDFLLDEYGKLKNTTKKGMDIEVWLNDSTLVESGHMTSSGAVGPGSEEILVLQSAHKNRRLAATVEHPKKGAHIVDDSPVLDIDGIAVDQDLALDWFDAELITLDTLKHAKLIKFN